jgi:uncharacterized protein YPO0396
MQNQTIEVERDNMKTLTRIRLVNWHLFENTTINCQGTTYFIGINGAGKSTILDAVQFALVGGQRDVRYNQAAVSGSKRTLSSYVRGEMGTEGQRFLRGDVTGVVALEFRNPDMTYFVHGALIDAFEDGRNPEVAYFIVHNARLDDNWFFRAQGQLFDTRAFKRHLEHYALPPAARAQVFSRLEDYRIHLLNRLGQLKDTFPAKIVKGLAFSPLTDIRSFVQNYLLDEHLVDVKTLQAQLETLRHFETLAANVRERIAMLNHIEEMDKERSANRRRRITNGYIRRRAQGDVHMGELKDHRLELDEARLELSRAERKGETLAQQYRQAQTLLVDATVALQTDQTAQRERDLSEKIATINAEVNLLRQRKAQASQALAHEAADAQKLLALIGQEEREAPASLVDFVQQAGAAGSPLQNQPVLQAVQETLSALAQAYSREEALLDERSRVLREEAAHLADEIRKLHTGDREISFKTEAPQAVRLRELLRAELHLNAGDVTFLCTHLQIPDEKWQDAVEGILGHNRFVLLVPRQHFSAAMGLYRERRGRDNLFGVALLDTERILQSEKWVVRKGALAEEVETTHPAARAFVDMLLGSYTKCETLEDLRQYRTAVTRECFVRRNFTDSHLNPQVYQHWFIGDRSAQRQIEQREASLSKISEELATLQGKSMTLHERLLLTRDKVRPLIDLEHALENLGHLEEMEAQLAALITERQGLDSRSVDLLRVEVQRCQQESNRLQNEMAAFERHIGNLETSVKTLEMEQIPELERLIDQALQSAEEFLKTESVDEEGGADIQQEYQRRGERQPVDVIVQNATRYENEYQSAEQRSRDKLREAKQAYSLRYDFGYDDVDEAARYIAERDKLVQSELPQYEEQISRQRSLAEQELVENFIHRLREQIEDARQQLAFLNSTLSNLRFGGERFEFIIQPSPALRQVYDMIMDSQNILGDSLFESGFRQKHQQGWDLLFDRLTMTNDDENQELRELQDYRNYLQYDIRIHYPNNDRALLSQINAKKSGGETTTPFYVAMAASFAQAYRLNQPRPSDTIRLALFDEAFGKMDTARTASALQFMREAGLQVLLATPPDKSGSLLPYVDSVCTVVRQNNHAHVVEISKAEMVEEMERATA